MNDETHDFDADAEIAFLRETPAPDLLANHFFVLAQWAAVHLATSPADLVGAQLVIDAMSAVLDAGGERLGPNVTLYRSALAEIQQVYVRASQVARAPANAPINTDTDTDTVTDTVTDSPPTPGPATDPATDPA